ncbi:MAG TPA: hypothetical protein VHI93_09190 [Candidatus Thermoplasmatota archaeon]|nr:hypothetical protein [Candidatus Thermoplasmatota archaeon]
MKAGRVQQWARTLSEAVVGVGALGYILGFLAWSIYALRNQLGFLRLSVPQYLVVGEMFGAILAGLVLLDYVMAKGLWKHYAHKPATRRFRTERLAMEALAKALALVALSFLLKWTSAIIPLVDSDAAFGTLNLVFIGSLAIAILLLGAGVLHHLSDNGKGKRVGKLRPREGGVVGVSAAWAITLFLTFPTAFLPAIPLEFGGAQPRLAHLDVDATQMAHETGLALVPASQWDSRNHTVRTVKVWVLFDGIDSLLVQPAALSANGTVLPRPDANLFGFAARHGETFHVSSSVVKAKIWLRA